MKESNIEKESTARTELALKRYAILNAYKSYEGNMYWVRSQNFLIAHSALFGFVFTNFPLSIKTSPLIKFYILIIPCIAGLILALLWRRVLKSGEQWVQHWDSILIKLENDAFGDIQVHRPFTNKLRPISAKATARIMSFLFIILWVFSLCFSIFSLVLKIIGYELY